MRYTVCVPVHTIQMRVQSTYFCCLRRIGDSMLPVLIEEEHLFTYSTYSNGTLFQKCPLHIYTGILSVARQEPFSLSPQMHSNTHLNSFQFFSRLIYLMLNCILCKGCSLFIHLVKDTFQFAIQIKNKAAITNQSQVVV